MTQVKARGLLLPGPTANCSLPNVSRQPEIVILRSGQ
jgi:hypothetical protein